MIVRKLRLQRGWSQEQLATLTGLSIRTIQRIERGQNPGLDSLMALAAVFEVPVSELQPRQESTMQQPISPLEEQEQIALANVRDLKGFYNHLIHYVIVISLLFVINLLSGSDYWWAFWPMLGWGIGIISHAVNVFELFSFFGPEWEKRQVEKRLGRRL
ncbi:2TM domain-containing protein [Pseudaeromonas sharmana]|uniref:2TM domain-containing protein n=1 Tax=Pseudaeromonas sharmana TaxID=328412 RepID=A0ABV8CKD8_9GAMM